MKKVKFEDQTEVIVKNIKGFMKRRVVVSGTSAKITCPKEYLDYDAILIILENGTKKEGNKARRKFRTSFPKNRRTTGKNRRTTSRN